MTYQNPVDGTILSGMLVVPAGEGPFPGVVLLTLAGADEVIGGLKPTRVGGALPSASRNGDP